MIMMGGKQAWAIIEEITVYLNSSGVAGGAGQRVGHALPVSVQHSIVGVAPECDTLACYEETRWQGNTCLHTDQLLRRAQSAQ